MSNVTYIRDSRSPVPKNENVSKVMSANKGKNTKPENLLEKALWKIGLRRYRIHPKNIPGNTDVYFSSSKIVTFETGLKDCSGLSAAISNSNIVQNENSIRL